ncbi:tetratricopeptide repeat protein [candidate division KSB1 bacterium]
MYKKIILSNKIKTLPVPDENNEMKYNIIQDLINKNKISNKVKTVPVQNKNNVIKHKISKDFINENKIGGNKMKLCIIKNCREEAYKKNFCAKHYVEIMKKDIQELNNENLSPKISNNRNNGNGLYGREGASAKIQFFMHSLLAYVERFTDISVSAFDNLFNLRSIEVADIYREIGSKYIRKEKYKRAIPILTKVVDLNPTDAESIYNLGSAYLTEGLLDKAMICYKKAIQLNPNNQNYYYEISIAYEKKNRIDEAINSLKKAVELDNSNPEVHYRLGIIYDNKGAYENAVSSYKNAVELNPRQSNYYHSLGFAYESLNLRKEAVNCFKKAIALEQSVI